MTGRRRLSILVGVTWRASSEEMDRDDGERGADDGVRTGKFPDSAKKGFLVGLCDQTSVDSSCCE